MVTADTNIAFYALHQDPKTEAAEAVLAKADFLSAQVFNEYAFASKRKLSKSWPQIRKDLALLQTWVQDIRPIDIAANVQALRITERYEISFFDALMLAVALINGATIFYSEDMQHGQVIDGSLTIIDPFRTARS